MIRYTYMVEFDESETVYDRFDQVEIKVSKSLSFKTKELALRHIKYVIRKGGNKYSNVKLFRLPQEWEEMEIEDVT